DDAFARQACWVDQPGKHPECQIRVDVLRQDLAPACGPSAEGGADIAELAAGVGEPVARPGTPRFSFDNPSRFQVAQALRQHAARQTWRTVEDLAESLAAEHQVADDDRSPALSEDLSTERDGAVLTIATHESILTSPAPAV